MNLALRVSFMFNQKRGNSIKENNTQKTPLSNGFKTESYARPMHTRPHNPSGMGGNWFMGNRPRYKATFDYL